MKIVDPSHGLALERHDNVVLLEACFFRRAIVGYI